jgi:hypothetical protein
VGGIEQPERDVQGFSEAPVAVVVHLTGVHDGADPQLPLEPASAGETGVVVGQQLAQGRDSGFQQGRGGGLVDRADEREDAVAAVGEPVSVVTADPGREQCRVEELVELGAGLGLDRSGRVVERSMSRAITARWRGSPAAGSGSARGKPAVIGLAFCGRGWAGGP